MPQQSKIFVGVSGYEFMCLDQDISDESCKRKLRWEFGCGSGQPLIEYSSDGYIWVSVC